MSIRPSTAKHEIAYQDLAAFLKKHTGSLDALEMLAVAANMLGKLVALQDQRKVTSAQAMEIVARNIEVGNQQVLAELAHGAPAGRA